MNKQGTQGRDGLTHLLTRSADGDRQAFTELYNRTSGRLYGVCLRMLRDRGAAEEVLQETYITVWNRAEHFDAGRASAITWLMTVGRNKAIDRLRRHRETPYQDPRRIDEVPDTDMSPPADAETSQEYQRLAQCLDGLDARHRKFVRAAFFTGATYKELAARAEVPLGTMKSWIRRSLVRLRACLEQ